jgi:hypothetical protein
MWTRDQPPAPVRFAKEIKVVSYRELVDSFDRPYDGIIYMTSEDATRYSPGELESALGFKTDQRYRNFKRVTPDRLTFLTWTLPKKSMWC